MIEQGDMHKIFSPGARQTLTNDSRQKSGAVQVGEQWTRVGPLLSTYRIDMHQRHRDPRPTFPFSDFAGGLRGIAAPRYASPTEGVLKKMAAL
ncbi:hypothetical protein Xkhy_00190 [Xanthomonas axonopodis pv. khayae]|uniref:hypothetical protein n=1 Tax=Xanthomonas axonopodis TaxID=53413 RepID=UPI0009988EF7|nr:hypothetical protein [Xanthomonas axonopodis]OOW87857.1 hypothetical protein Xvtf_13960 [Xanthomonas campestris pv. vitistrifoliae]OOX09013.1 hypothetical protein Xkhy_00190 [Xanthomonas axonopodis pv. khayae]